ncbi:helix-turn-helix transcriptional regulator [Paenibacillus gansuensis]|uniref:Helix-turn-helix transcriptional regulator n=1 Tax=Paenibacillus gansuensis TaxID=306542 RepID=A0ABW5PE52_9BACL
MANERRIAMMKIIDSRKKFTARELAERFQVSIRTIQRDLDYLQSIGFPLYTEVGPQGGYRALPNRILPPLQLNPSEALGLFLMLQFLEQLSDFPYSGIRHHLADQYYASLPGDIRERIDQMRAHVAFRQPFKAPPSPFTTPILEAAMQKQAVSFTYRGAGGLTENEAYPFGLYYENGRWYMPARKSGSIRLYRADRIQRLEQLPDKDDGVPSLQQWLNSRDNRPDCTVVLRFTDFGRRLAESDPLYGQLEHPVWTGNVPEEEFPFHARQLLRFGPEVKVEQPEALQLMVKELLAQSLQQYSRR